MVVETYETLAILALYVAAAGGFIPLGLHLLGKGKPEEVGANTFFLGIFQFLAVCYLFYLALANSIFGVLAINVAALSFIWLTLGLTLMRGWGLLPIGYHLLISTVIFIILAIWYIITLQNYSLAIMNLTYAITVFAAFLFIIGVLKTPKIPAYCLLVFGVITVLIPAILLFFTELP